MRWLVLLLLALAVASCSARQDQSTPTTDTQPSTTTTTAIGDYEQLDCPDYDSARKVGEINDDTLDELSGLALGRTNPDLLWTHNDSGDSPRVFAIDKSGRLRATVDLSNASALDYEDIATSSKDGRNRVWVADTGDNFHLRGAARVYSFEEPELSNSSSTMLSVTTKELVVRFRQPGTTDEYESVNSEAFFIDNSGNGYFVAKVNDEKTAWVFRVTARDMEGERAVAEPLVEIQTNRKGDGVGATAADLSADGETLVIKNYNETFLWHFEGDPAAALTEQPVAPCVEKAGSGEAIAVLDNGDLLTVEEGSDSALLESRRR